MFDTSLTTLQEQDVTMEWKRADGNPATVDGATRWSSANSDVVAVIPNGNHSAIIRTRGSMTDTDAPIEIVATVDARFGDEVLEISEIIRVTVTRDTRDEATNGVPTFGSPRDRTE